MQLITSSLCIIWYSFENFDLKIIHKLKNNRNSYSATEVDLKKTEWIVIYFFFTFFQVIVTFASSWLFWKLFTYCFLHLDKVNVPGHWSKIRTHYLNKKNTHAQ
jgi:hypothetical protein